MRTINRTGIAALALAAMLMPAAWAQDAQQAGTPPPPPPGAMGDHGGHGRMSPEKQLHHMTRQLNLNAEQQQQVGQILRDRDAQMMQAHQNPNGDQRAMRQQMRTMMADSDAKIRAVLNPDQQQKFEAMRAEQRDHMRGGRGGDGAPPMDGQGAPPQQ